MRSLLQFKIAQLFFDAGKYFDNSPNGLPKDQEDFSTTEAEAIAEAAERISKDLWLQEAI